MTPGVLPGGREYLFHDIAYGRLAVRSGDAQQFQLHRGVVEERVGEPPEGGAGVANTDDDGAGNIHVILDHDCRRAPVDGGSDVPVAVGNQPLDRDEEAAPGHGARIVKDIADLDIEIPPVRQHLNIAYDTSQFHRYISGVKSADPRPASITFDPL